MNVFDFDGVVSIGLMPLPGDVIITGRGYDEAEVVFSELRNKLPYANFIPVYFNPKTKINGRTRDDSGNWKAFMILELIRHGAEISTIFEDDEEQFDIIQEALDSLSKFNKPNLCKIECDWVNK